MTRALLPKLIERQGQIINLSSVAATHPYKGGAIYAGTKAFVRQFSLDLRCDLHGTGVRVTSVEPGMAETEFTIVRSGGDKEASDKLYAGVNPLTSYQYTDIGTNIDCGTAVINDGRFRVDLTIDDSSVYPEDQVRTSNTDRPSFRSFRATNSMVLKDGQTTQFTSAVDKVTGIVTKVDVTLTVVK